MIRFFFDLGRGLSLSESSGSLSKSISSSSSSHKNHITQMVEQLERPIKDSPILTITGNQTTIDEFNINDFKVSGYDPAPFIRAPMAV